MSRPQPRQSTISRLSPITPSTSPQPREAQTKSHTTKTTQQVTVQIDKEIISLARGAYLSDLTNGQPISFSKWVENALRDAIKQTSIRNGQTIQPVETGILPKGIIPGTTKGN